MLRLVNRPLSLLVLAAVLLLGSGVGAGQAATTHLVTFHGNGFSISLPGKPKRRTLSLGIVGKEALYLVSTKTRAAGIGYLHEPAHTGAVDLAATIKGEALGAGGSSAVVHDAVDTTYQGFPARDGRITVKKQKSTIFTRVIDTGQRLYILVYIIPGTTHTKTPALYTKIRDSLKLA